MIGYRSTFTRLVAAFVAFAGFFLLAGCGSVDSMVKDQQAYNRQTCQGYGLYPGSSEYIECVSNGADVYAQSHKDKAGAKTLPWNRPANNVCNAEPSKPNGSCPACSVSCGSDKQASCKQGEEWPGGSPTCMKNAVCECR